MYIAYLIIWMFIDQTDLRCFHGLDFPAWPLHYAGVVEAQKVQIVQPSKSMQCRQNR